MNYIELKTLIKHHNRLYYDLSNPEISDENYDKIYSLLEETEANQGYKTSDSPTLKVGGVAGKVKHPYQLYSLQKVYEINDIDASFDICTPKIDGTNLTCVYYNGKLKVALTRGDGEFGEDVSHLASYIKGIPETIKTTRSIVAINGECVTEHKNVDNFRNYVSGAIGLKDPNEFKTRAIMFIAHDFLGINEDYLNKLKLATQFGFYTVLDSMCDKFPQDGLVYRINSNRKSVSLGYTSKYPKFAVALKEREHLTAITTLQDVVWVVGRTGTVNPIGQVSPVIIDGATISRVTLHNLEYIESHDLGLGDLIQLERAGGVIPKFNRVLQHSENNLKIKQSHAEVYLNTKLRKDGPKLYVTENSQASTFKLLEHFVKIMDIKGLGPASLKSMGLIHPIDLFKKDNNWSSLGANGKKIIDQLEVAKHKPYAVVLAALGIPGIGKNTAKTIVQYIPSFNRLKTIEDTHIKGIGPKTIAKIVAWLDINYDWVTTLPLRLEVDQSEILDFNDFYEDKVVCITGTLDISRTELTELLNKKGIAVKNSVTKDCVALIYDGKAVGSKYNKAVQNGIKIINYWDNKTKILNGYI